MSPALVGYVAAAMTVCAFVPQAWRIIKTRDTHSLATSMWVLQVGAFSGWIVYGTLLGEVPIVVPNTICLVLSLFILTMKLVPRRTRDRIADVIDPAHAPIEGSGS